MNISIFDTQEKANAFINSVDVEKVEIHDGKIYVWHKPELTPEEFEKMIVSRRRRNAEMDLVQFRVHEAYLNTIKLTGTQYQQLQDKKAENETAINNARAAMELFGNWEPLQ